MKKGVKEYRRVCLIKKWIGGREKTQRKDKRGTDGQIPGNEKVG